jgi:hypothetical protein
VASQDDQRDAGERTHRGRGQNDRQQHLPAEPGAEGRQQLEVAVTHALLASSQAEEVIHGPEAQVPRDGADDR